MKQHWKKITWLSVMLSTLILLSAPNIETRGAVYWASANGIALDQGVRSKLISVCFAGSAVSNRSDRVSQILGYLKEYEYAANLRFSSLGACPSPTAQSNGNDYYDGDIRVLIPGALFDLNAKDIFSQVVSIPGKGCTEQNSPDPTNTLGSWSSAPWDLPKNRACLYNMKLGDDPFYPPSLWSPSSSPAGTPLSATPYRNHTLHEFGHALGFAHEHERKDADSGCISGGIKDGLLTPYDKTSVMHYQFKACGINGNYDNTGLSSLDKLAVHILYPEDDRVAEFIGTTVVRTSATLNLQSAWQARGANMSFVAKNFNWKISGQTLSTTPTLSQRLRTAGDYQLQLTYSDFLGRSYLYNGLVHVLTPEAFDRLISATEAAILPLSF
jgi:hypothetical protein